MFEIWDKNKIGLLENHDIEQWFDVLNYKLEEDRDISLNDPDYLIKQKQIKIDYVNYLKGCPNDSNFYKYYIYRDHYKIVSLCRINIIDGKYILEGLQTHKDFYKNGYAIKLIDHMLSSLYSDGINVIHSEVRVWNEASNQLHKKLGFIQYKDEGNNHLYKIDIETYKRKKLFNEWAKNYNQAVLNAYHLNQYPFAGYFDIRFEIMNIIKKNNVSKILDMGIGSGEMVFPLYELGYEITGVDLSQKMIDIAKTKMPNIKIILSTFDEAIELMTEKFDVIMFNYAIHHMTYDKQIKLLQSCDHLLNKNGLIIIGDVSTKSTNQMKQQEAIYKDIWDDEEYYPIFEIYGQSKLKDMYDMDYKSMTDISGIIILKNKGIKYNL